MNDEEKLQEWLDKNQSGPAIYRLGEKIGHPAWREMKRLEELDQYPSDHYSDLSRRLFATPAREWLDLGVTLDMVGWEHFEHEDKHYSSGVVIGAQWPIGKTETLSGQKFCGRLPDFARFDPMILTVEYRKAHDCGDPEYPYYHEGEPHFGRDLVDRQTNLIMSILKLFK